MAVTLQSRSLFGSMFGSPPQKSVEVARRFGEAGGEADAVAWRGGWPALGPRSDTAKAHTFLSHRWCRWLLSFGAAVHSVLHI